MVYVIAKGLIEKGKIMLKGGSGLGTTTYGRGSVIADDDIDMIRYWATKLESNGHEPAILDEEGNECELVECEIERVVVETKTIIKPVKPAPKKHKKEAVDGSRCNHQG